ncbi:hypothetical protein HDU96_011065 [Phlyctochytrium bullatum]|nr:hypothetical protein HDU96_011065 [Phlyctochytrium bullatum]
MSSSQCGVLARIVPTLGISQDDSDPRRCCSAGYATCDPSGAILTLDSAEDLVADDFLPVHFDNRDLSGRGFQNVTFNDTFGDLPRLQELNLKGNGFHGRFGPWITKLVDLRTIDLSNTLITGVIPREIGRLSALESIIFGNCHFTGSLPGPALANLTRLRVLDLSNNTLRGRIPAEMGNMPALNVLSEGSCSVVPFPWATPTGSVVPTGVIITLALVLPFIVIAIAALAIRGFHPTLFDRDFNKYGWRRLGSLKEGKKTGWGNPQTPLVLPTPQSQKPDEKHAGSVPPMLHNASADSTSTLNTGYAGSWPASGPSQSSIAPPQPGSTAGFAPAPASAQGYNGMTQLPAGASGAKLVAAPAPPLNLTISRVTAQQALTAGSVPPSSGLASSPPGVPLVPLGAPDRGVSLSPPPRMSVVPGSISPVVADGVVRASLSPVLQDGGVRAPSPSSPSSPPMSPAVGVAMDGQVRFAPPRSASVMPPSAPKGP